MSGFGAGGPLRLSTPSSGVTPFVLIAVVVAVAATLVGAALLVVRRGGEAAADANESALIVADRAADAEAHSWLRNAVTAVRTLSAEGGGANDAVTPDRLAAIDQGVTFTTGPAGAPRVVSVAGTASAFGAAARSGSGTCFWIRDGASGTLYGAGEPCTGAAALGAVQPTW